MAKFDDIGYILIDKKDAHLQPSPWSLSTMKKRGLVRRLINRLKGRCPFSQ